MDLSKLNYAIRKLSEDDVALFMIELTCKKLNGFNFHFCSVFKKRTRQNSLPDEMFLVILTVFQQLKVIMSYLTFQAEEISISIGSA